MAIGLKDIAEELNISVSLVSKVLSGRLGTSGASQNMRDRILQTAQDLGYQPNRNAAALAMGRNNAIGLFVHELGASGSGLVESILRGVGRSTHDRRQRLWFSFIERDEDLQNLYMVARNSGIDGLICAGMRHQQPIEELTRLSEDGIPVVTIHSYSPDPLPNIGVNEEQTTALPTRHLIKQGCRRIAHLRVQEDRYLGYRDELVRGGLKPDPKLIISVPDFEYPSGIKAANHLLDEGIAFDGVVCQSDQLAAGVQSALLRRGILIPEQVRITGVDNSAIARHAVIPITSVDQHFTERGSFAVDLLYDLMSGAKAKSSTVAPRLVVRESSA